MMQHVTEIQSGVTKLDLLHEGIPLEDKHGNHSIPEKVEAGWKEFFFDRIHKVIGFGKHNFDEDSD
jgi:hypothetical protein